MSEQTPLLGAHENGAAEFRPATPDSVGSHSNKKFPTRSWPKARSHWRQWKPIYLCCLLLIMLEVPGDIVAAPAISLIENGVCRDVYGDAMNDKLCSGKRVQTQVANVRSIMSILALVPSLLLSIPYGMLADKKGRKLVIALVIIGAWGYYAWTLMVLYFYNTFPFWTVYFSAAFLWLGGGGFVIASLISAIIADVVSDEARTRVFFIVGIVGTVVDVIAPQFGKLIMERHGAFAALLTTTLLTPLSLIALVLLPETAPSRSKPGGGASDSSASTQKQSSSVRETLFSVVDHVRDDLLPILGSTIVLRTMFSFFVVFVAGTMNHVVLQYVHVRFGWKYERTTDIMSFKAVIHIILLCTALPFFYSFLAKRNSPEHANLTLSKVSVVFDLAGTLLLGLSVEPAGFFVAIAIQTFGTGFSAALKSFVTSLVPKEEVALLYMLISVFACIGEMVGTPLLTLSLSLGIKHGGWLIGLPFFIAAGLYALSALSIWSIRIPVKKEDDEGEQADE